MHDDETTAWLRKLADGDERAAQEIWNRYCQQLVRVARWKFREKGFPQRSVGESDVALSAFESFCRGVTAGKFTSVNDRDDLRRMLVTMTARKALAYVRRERRIKRGGGKVVGESAFVTAGSEDYSPGIQQVMGREPTPEFASLCAEECERLLDKLKDPSLRKVALMKLAGHSVDEIAQEMDVCYKTAKNRLRKIRQLWASDVDG